ncbi:MAG: TolC family protein [Verrucomicrobiales bacterium]|nr:TolC family protein [Verrucomicrobiales bacterium]
MSRYTLWKIVCLGIALVSASTARVVGAGAPSFTATIDQLIRLGLRQNAELGMYEAELAAAKGERMQSGLWKNPEFSAEYGSRRVSDNGGNLQGDGYTRSFAVMQSFEFPGKGSLRKAIADKNIELAELGLQQFRQALGRKIRGLALKYVAATAHADATAEISGRCAALVKLLRERPLAGVPQLLELRVIEGSLSELQQSAKEFTQVREETRLELNALLGLPASQPLTVNEELAPPPAAGMSLDALIMNGLSGNLQLKMRKVEVEKTAKQVSAAKLDIAPDFSVGPFFSQDKAGDLEENFGAAISVTLPLWNWNQGNIGVAEARRQQADILLHDARRKVEAEIARCYRAYELNRKQFAQMPRLAVGELREAADLADRQYRTGAISVQLFLDVQRQFLSVQQIRNNVVLEMWNNRLDLELLTGCQFPDANPEAAK